MNLRHALPLSLLAAAGACATSAPPHSTIPPVAGERQSVQGVDYIDVRTGTGAIAEPGKCYHLHYTGWLSNGRQFDTSRGTDANGRLQTPIAFRQGARQVIPGWERSIVGMRVGGERRLFIPSYLGYGERGAPPAIPPNASLVFDVELMAVTEPLRGGGCVRWEEVPPAR